MLESSKIDVFEWISWILMGFLVLLLLVIIFIIVDRPLERATTDLKDLRQKLKPRKKLEFSMESSGKSLQERIKAIEESVQATNQKVMSDKQRQKSLKEMKYFVIEILFAAALFVFAFLSFNSAINSESIKLVQYRILIGHIMAFVIALFLPFPITGLYWLPFTPFPSPFETLLTLAILTTVRYFSKSSILTKIFPLDLFLTGITLWIASFLTVIGFEAFLQNGFETYPLKLMVIVGIFGGFGLNIYFLRKEY